MDGTAGEEPGIFAIESPYLDRYVQIGMAGGKLISLSLPRTPDEEAGDGHPLLDRIERYLDGAKVDFAEVDVGLTVPTEQRRVLEALRNVGYGTQVSVERLAGMVEGLDAAEDADRERVRAALAENPIPLVIPDHRVRDGPSGAPPDVEQRLRSLEGL